MKDIRVWLQPLLEEMGCKLYDLEWDKSSKTPVLRISIERNGQPVDLDLCSEVSRAVSDKLDQLDEDDDSYILEVCSAGIERPLETTEQLENAIGDYVEVNLINPIDGVHKIEGTLKEVNNDFLVLAYFIKGRPKKTKIERSNIKDIHYAVKI